MKKKNITTASIISTAILSLSAANTLAHMEPKTGDDMEKCYGVAKAGKNDCSSKAGKHGCAGMAKTSSSADEWIKLPKGLCDKLVFSSLTAGEAHKAKKVKGEKH
ncbi:MAG: hypothetical protein COB14_04310 [Alphaproteobacteria bacterium]|nr:MAG: hypothetical protein COB14_04310 [Alphaproteobacteria bacterium]